MTVTSYGQTKSERTEKTLTGNWIGYEDNDGIRELFLVLKENKRGYFVSNSKVKKISWLFDFEKFSIGLAAVDHEGFIDYLKLNFINEDTFDMGREGKMTRFYRIIK